MMAEQWYAVGDHVRIEPFADMQGVVERVTLRSTRIRGLNGEIVWVNNQNIQAIRIIPKGLVTMALEIFVTDPDKGSELIASVNRRLPTGELLVINPLQVMTTGKVGESLWHITAIAETAPGREWMIEKYAKDLMIEIDDERKLGLLAADPVARFADSEAEREFARAITNARKAPAVRRARRKPVAKPQKNQNYDSAYTYLTLVESGIYYFVMTAQIYGMRHGESSDNLNRAGLFGNDHARLTPLGHEQTKWSGQYIGRALNIGLVLCSTMVRARQSAANVMPYLAAGTR